MSGSDSEYEEESSEEEDEEESSESESEEESSETESEEEDELNTKKRARDSDGPTITIQKTVKKHLGFRYDKQQCSTIGNIAKQMYFYKYDRYPPFHSEKKLSTNVYTKCDTDVIVKAAKAWRARFYTNVE